MPRDAIQVVCFDLGDVLIRICRGWRHACECAGVTREIREPDAATKAAIHDVIVDSEVGRIDQATFAARVAPLLGVETDDVLKMSDAYLLGPYPGVPELIEDVNAAGVATACLSNTNASHWSLMTCSGGRCELPLAKMTYRFASQLVGARKPDAAIYEHVERITGLAPAQLLFFDNLAENIEAALARGWRGEIIDPGGDPVAQMREHLRRYDVLPAPQAATR